MTKRVGLLHPGAMGSTVGACAQAAGAEVFWVGRGRSEATRGRARDAGLVELDDLGDFAERADIVVSVCPPAEASALAASVFEAGFAGIYVDANAVQPETARAMSRVADGNGARFVDGGLVGPPARSAGSTVLYLSGSGPEVQEVAGIFEGSFLETVVVPGQAGVASALKMAYAAYTKGHAAMLLAVRALARAEGVEEALLGHWDRTHPHLEKTAQATARGTAPKAWRFEGEMREIAATFAGAGLPSGFHEAAAEVYARLETFRDSEDANLDDVLAKLLS